MKLFNDLQKVSGATFSECRQYRYQLWRIWNGDKAIMNVIGLNPSTADHENDDPTIRRCIGFARAWGYGGLYMTNLFAFRATEPKVMKQAPDPIGPENDRWIRETAAGAGLVVAAWGENGSFQGRDKIVERLVSNLHVFRLTGKSRMPEHPLYLPKELTPVRYIRGCND